MISIWNLESGIWNLEFNGADAMDFFMSNILNIVCFLPLAGLILIMFIKRESENAIKWVANVTAFIGFLVSIPLLTSFNNPRFISPNGFRFIYEHSWIPEIGANYKFGIDGISMLLVLLTTLLGFVAILSSWSAIKDRVKEYYAFMLLLQTGMLGRFYVSRLPGLLCLLGSDAGSHVFPDRRLGRATEAVCCHQVFPLYPGGFRAHARGNSGNLLLSARCHGY